MLSEEELKQLAEKDAKLFADTFFETAESLAKKYGMSVEEFLSNWTEKVLKFIGDKQ